LTEKHHHTLTQELLALQSERVPYLPIAAILCMAMIAWLVYQQAPAEAMLLAGWLGAVVLVQLLSVAVLRGLARKDDLDDRQRLHLSAFLNFGNALLYSLSLVFFPLLTPLQAALQSLLLIGLGAASVGLVAGYLPFTLAHVVLGAAPLIGMWAWSGSAGPGGDTAYLMSVAAGLYAVAALFIARRMQRLFTESFENRQRLIAALAEAEAAGRAKTRFLAAASHDLRQPIHTLSLFSAALGMRSLDERTGHIAASIDAAVKALAYQLDALLDISKLDAGVVTMRESRFNLKQFLTRLRNEFNVQAEDREIRLTLNCPADAIVTTDSALLERIIRNLLTNAISYNMKCTIQIAAERQGENWQLSIADTGSGIPEAEQAKIFEEFYQLDNPERDRSRGLGLGLAIVKRLSLLLNFDMQFESEPGWGTRFTFQLPAGAALAGTINGVDLRHSSLEDLNILVVDDESTVREGMRVLLEVMGCRVQTAGSTSAAISIATSDKPDLALVDFRLRDHDSGLNTIDRLRHLYPGLPAIIISGDTAPDRLMQARSAGIAVLSKPVLVDPLKQAISKACHIDAASGAA
jgi:signal transduction histidine kinase/CheY-like chemotaxis protein